MFRASAELDPNSTFLDKKRVLLKREQYFIGQIKPEYNILKTVGSGLGLHFPKETREKMRVNNAFSQKIYAYNKDGSILKHFYSYKHAGEELGIGRRIISSRLNQSNQKPVHLFNKELTNSYILSTIPLTKKELNEFILSDKGAAVAKSQRTQGPTTQKQVYAYT